MTEEALTPVEALFTSNVFARSVYLPVCRPPAGTVRMVFGEFEPAKDWCYPLEDFAPDDIAGAMHALGETNVFLISFETAQDESGIGRPSGWLLGTGSSEWDHWALAEGFMRLGFLPPIELADGLREDGAAPSPRVDWILQACYRSLNVALAHVTERQRHIARLSTHARRVKTSP